MQSLRAFLRECQYGGMSWDEMYDAAMEEFPKWRDTPLFITVAKVYGLNEIMPNLRVELKNVPCSKRGNKIYVKKLVGGLIAPLFELAKKDPKWFGKCSMLTLTSDKKKGLEWNSKNLSRAWNHLLTRVRQKLKRSPRFIRVVEISRKNSIHMHVLFFGVPFISQRWLSILWKKYHGAPIVHIQMVRNLLHGIKYVVKYLFKSINNELTCAWAWFNRKRQYTTSLGLAQEIRQRVNLISRKALINSKPSSVEEPLCLCLGMHGDGEWVEADGKRPPIEIKWGEISFELGWEDRLKALIIAKIEDLPLDFIPL